MSEDKKDKGWEYLQNDGEEGSFYEDDGSWGSRNSDGSGSYYGADEGYNGGPPSGKDVKDALEAKGKDGLEYTNGEPDFSEVAEGTVEIDDMSEERYGPDGNFAQANQALADKWNTENKKNIF